VVKISQSVGFKGGKVNQGLPLRAAFGYNAASFPGDFVVSRPFGTLKTPQSPSELISIERFEGIVRHDDRD
jgi:hypothetical protein